MATRVVAVVLCARLMRLAVFPRLAQTTPWRAITPPAIDAIRPAIIAPDAGFQGVLAATVTAENDFDRDPRVAIISYSDFLICRKCRAGPCATRR